MLVLPAIDLLEGKPVRLFQGDYEQKEVVGEDALKIARDFEKQGAPYLHIVDLDGAKSGQLVNGPLIRQLAKQLKIPLQVGGGIRDMEKISYYLEHGADRVILGTAALEQPNFLKEALAVYTSKIVVGVDIRKKRVLGHGWLEKSEVHYQDFVPYLEEIGVSTIIVTDIHKDGTLSGINESLYEEIRKMTDMSIIAAGGVKNLEDIRQAKILGLDGVITGKAIYSGTLDLKEALKLI